MSRARPVPRGDPSFCVRPRPSALPSLPRSLCAVIQSRSTSSHLRRDYAEIAPRSRRDRAEIATRSRRDRAEIGRRSGGDRRALHLGFQLIIVVRIPVEGVALALRAVGALRIVVQLALLALRRPDDGAALLGEAGLHREVAHLGVREIYYHVSARGTPNRRNRDIMTITSQRNRITRMYTCSSGW